MKNLATLFAICCVVVLATSRVAPSYQEDWEEVNYQNYETVETYLPPAYGVEHVDVYQPPPLES